jgi:hypothetical protein
MTRDNENRDADLTAVREALSARTADTDASVARSWAAMVAERAREGRRATAHPRRRSARWLVPVGAAATVAALAIGATALFSQVADPAGTTAAPSTGAGGTPTPASARPPAAVELSEGLLAAGTPVPIEDVLAELVAAGQLVEPVELTDGQLIYVRTVNWAQPDARPQLHETWTDPESSAQFQLLKIDGRVEETAASGDLKPPDLEFYRLLRPQGLTELPTDPEELLHWLREQTSPGPQVTSRYVIKELGQRLQLMDPVLTPEVRVALYQALAVLDGVSAHEIDDDGRRLVALRRHQEGGVGDLADELLVDPATGAVVGQRTLAGSAGENWPEGVLSVQVWTHGVVNGVEETG